MNKLKNELQYYIEELRKTDRQILIVLMSVAILQTISWYFTSRHFFRANFFYDVFFDDPLAELYEFIYWFVGDFLVLFVFPSLIVIIGFKKTLTQFGLNFKEVKTGLKYSLLFILIMIPILWIISAQREFALNYPHLSLTKSSRSIFLLYEIGILFYMFAWEFIWRGFMLFGLKAKFGIYAVFIQMIPFVILHNGKPFAETFGAIFGGLALGLLAFRTGSFLYGVIIHFGIMFIIDSFSIFRFNSQNYNIDFSSIVDFVRFFFKF